MTTPTMMDVPLTLDWIADRAERWNGTTEVVSRRADKTLARTTYGQLIARARQLARALIGAGLRSGDRVATLMWNHAEHLEAYFGIPLAGGVLHTLNLRLHPDEIAYIANDAGDRVLIVDDVLVPLYEKIVAAGARFERVIVVGKDYERFVDDARTDVALPALAETDALGICYTSGTTGNPKGVAYSHRSTLLHTIVSATPDALDLGRAATVLPVVPMFHANAWGIPYIAAMTGAKLVLPGAHLDAASLLDLMQRERVTYAAGVPTIWIGIRDALDAAPGTYELQPGLRMVVGGAAAPEQLIRDFDRLGMRLIHAWGMTETSPIGTVSLAPEDVADHDLRYKLRARQGRPVPLVELRVRNEAGDVPPDDRTTGEVLVRGPWIAGGYMGGHTPERWTPDGFFRTGDVARIDERGYIQLVDRITDLIKSGGEWIATVELENALMCHPGVREAAVVGVPHPRWGERPLAVIVRRDGANCTGDELRTFLAPRFARYCLPEAFEFVDAIPRTSAGKFKKSELRDRYRGRTW
jgi:fatty-acyl-CoA synthase